MSDKKNIVETVLNNFPELKVHTIDKEATPFTLVAGNQGIHSLEKFLKEPLRIVESITFNFSVGFCDYIEDFKDVNNTVIFANENEFKCIFDFHQKESPKRCTHVATYKISKSPEWEKWEYIQGSDLSQRDLLFHLREVKHTIVSPSGADVIGIIKSLESSISAKHVSLVNEDGHGSEIEFKRTAEVKSSTDLQIPKSIEIILEPFLGALNESGEPLIFKLNVAIDCSVNEENSRIKFRLSIPNFQRAKIEVFEELSRSIKKNTGVKLYLGGVKE